VATELMSYSRYSCPHCRLLLEARTGRWQGWVTCPNCGLAGLPPKRVTISRDIRRPLVVRQPASYAEIGIRSNGLTQEPASPASSTTPRRRRSPASGAPRVVASTGLFVSAFLMLIAYLDRSHSRLAIFGGLTFIFLVAVLRMTPPRT